MADNAPVEESVPSPVLQAHSQQKKIKRKRRRGRPALGKSRGEKRSAANRRERNRMRDLVRCDARTVIGLFQFTWKILRWYSTRNYSFYHFFFKRAYDRVRQRLPNNKDINSKKQIINQVWNFGFVYYWYYVFLLILFSLLYHLNILHCRQLNISEIWKPNLRPICPHYNKLNVKQNNKYLRI